MTGAQDVADDGLRHQVLVTQRSVLRSELELPGLQVEMCTHAKRALASDQQGTAFGAGVLHDDSQQAIQQRGQGDLAGERLRGTHGAVCVERQQRALRRGRGRELGVGLIERAHLAECTPLQVVSTRSAQIGARDLLIASPRKRRSGQLGGQASVMRVAVRRRQANRLVVELRGSTGMPLELGQLGAHEQMLVREVHRCALRPTGQELELRLELPLELLRPETVGHGGPPAARGTRRTCTRRSERWRHSPLQ